MVWSQVYARQSTSISMEGILAEECYKQAADEGCKVEVVWQDGDSRVAKAVGQHHHDGKVLRCGGHVGRVHRSCQKKEFSTDFKRKYEAQFPSVRTLNCKCDPPQDFQHNGDNTSTRAMTRHAKRDI